MIQYNQGFLGQIISLLQKLHPRFILPAKLTNDIEAIVLWTRLKNYKSKWAHLSMIQPFSPERNKIYCESYETLDPFIH